MSHKVTQKSEMKDLNMVVRACQDAGYSYNVNGNKVSFTSGPLSRATIDVSTGEITGDTDWHTRDALGKFRQNYAKAVVKHTCEQQNITIESEEVVGTNVVLYTYLA